MKKDELFKAFDRLFPDWVPFIKSYKKIGSKCLVLDFEIIRVGDETIDAGTRVFLYNDMNNWQFGTKLWRKRPERLIKKEMEG